MIGSYVITPLVFGVALSYLWLIRHSWLRPVFTESYRDVSLTAVTAGALSVV